MTKRERGGRERDLFPDSDAEDAEAVVGFEVVEHPLFLLKKQLAVRVQLRMGIYYTLVCLFTTRLHAPARVYYTITRTCVCLLHDYTHASLSTKRMCVSLLHDYTHMFTRQPVLSSRAPALPPVAPGGNNLTRPHPHPHDQRPSRLFDCHAGFCCPGTHF